MFLEPEFAVLQHTQEIAGVGGRDFHVRTRAVRDDFARHLARDVLNLSLQAANSRFVRVVPDDVKQAILRQLEVLVGKAGRFQRALH